MEPLIISMGGKFSALGLALFLFFFITMIAVVLMVGLMNFSSVGKISPDIYKRMGTTAEATPPTSGRIKLGQLILSIILFLFMSLYLVPPFFEFKKVVIMPDNTWKLKNGWSLTIGTLPPSKPRDIQRFDVTTIFTNTYRKVSNDSIHIVTEGRTYRSVGNVSLKKETEQLQDQAEKIQALKSFPVGNYYTIMRYLKYGLLALGVAVGYLFWKKK